MDTTRLLGCGQPVGSGRSAHLFRRGRPLLVAFLLAGVVVCSLLALRPAPEGIEVLVARRTLEEGDPLDSGALRTIRVPPEAVPQDALRPGAQLPTHLPGGALPRGTMLSETTLAGSAQARTLAPHQARVALTVPMDQAVGLEPGDTVDIWSAPQMCDGSGCEASLLAEAVRLTSKVVDEDSSWGNSPTARVGLVLRAVDTGRVLGHTGTGTLSLVLRP